MIKSTTFQTSLLDFVAKHSGVDVMHWVFVGTKPDLIKQAPVLKALVKAGHKTCLIHTGQHYDENLSKGIEAEFGLTVDANLQVHVGSIGFRIGDIIQKVDSLLEAVLQVNPDIRIVPYVHGDTTTCFAATTACFHRGFPGVHIEAGIRTAMMKREILDEQKRLLDFKAWFKACADKKNYTFGSHEPFPEQWNTRASDAGTGLYMAPTPESAWHLEQEGYPQDRIKLVGNSVVDAMNFTDEIESDVFDQYPLLKNGFIRFCVHRRENTSDKKRFTALFECFETLAAKTDITLLWILLPGTKAALEAFGLQERLQQLESLNHVMLSDVWPKYSDVMAAMKECTLCLTDSGSMQEEMNMMQIPTLTLRYGSDRPETLYAGCNGLCPPEDSDFMVWVCLQALDHLDLFQYPALYGEWVSDKIVKEVEKGLEKDFMRLVP